MKAVNFLRKLLGNLLKRQKNKGFKPAPDITGLNKEHHRDVVWSPVSPWSKRRWRGSNVQTIHGSKNDKMKNPPAA